MHVIVIGLNHSTAPVQIREKITFPGDEDGEVTRSLKTLPGVEEAVVVSTCNRAEIITTTEDPVNAAEELVQAIGDIHGVDPNPFRPYLYIKDDAEAVRHVLRVTSSLDSMVVGEPQILGQVKESYRRATDVEATGPIINRLMHRAFFTAKRIRNETGIGRSAVSVAYAAVELARKILGELRNKRVLLIGAGEMAELAARHLMAQVDHPVVVTNRTYVNACTLASELGGTAVPMEELDEGIAAADVIITSTGSCDPIIGRAGIEAVMPRRRYRPIFLIDIAIPRDVEPEVNDVDGVYLYNIDDLQAVVDENLDERQGEALKGETIVEEEVTKFMSWIGTLDAAPTIVALKDKMEKIREGEMVRMNGKLSELNPREREAVETITRSIINKIAHDPIVFLKKAGASSKRNYYLDIAQKLFDLNGLSPTPDSGEEKALDS
ncbi:glutamyl-tRNA reductase [Thermodesulfobacteriota bacterium]